jgi:large subunit ribosomal protein L17
MLSNMVTSLLRHEAITTTVPRAKEARRVAEKIITLGKHGGLHNVRQANRWVRDREVLQKVFGELKDRYAKRQGGYTRILRTEIRSGDAAQMALLELVDRPEGGASVEAPAPEPKPKAEKKAKEPKAEKPAEEKKEAKAKAPKAEKAAAKSEKAEKAPAKKAEKKSDKK